MSQRARSVLYLVLYIGPLHGVQDGGRRLFGERWHRVAFKRAAPPVATPGEER